MKALRKISKQPNELVLQEVNVPTIQAHEVLIEVIYAGVCGTDHHILKNEYPTTPPITLGHEFVGKIAEIGEDVTAFSIGDTVVSLTAATSCGTCDYCLQQTPMLCAKKQSIGSQKDGVFAQYFAIDASRVFALPAHVPLKSAALAEPLACVFRGLVERSHILAKDQVVVSGPGAIGILTAILAKHLGAQVTLVGLASDLKRLQIANEHFAIHTVTLDTITEQSLPSFDVAIECSGHPSSLHNCILWTKKQGRLIQLGLFGKPVEVDLDLILTKELTLSNSFATSYSSWLLAIDFLKQNTVDLQPIITDVLSLEQWTEAFTLSSDKLKSLFALSL